MRYITAAALADRPGVLELAQVATPSHLRVVPAELMDATLRAEDRSSWTAAEVQAADDALQCITSAVDQAESLIDGYLMQRGYSLPLSPVPALVSGWARDISRYMLHKDRRALEDTDPIARAYRDALRLLTELANGRFSLGATDPLKGNPQAVEIQVMSDAPVFDRRQLRGFR
jgi:phage gp36-like protein